MINQAFKLVKLMVTALELYDKNTDSFMTADVISLEFIELGLPTCCL